MALILLVEHYSIFNNYVSFCIRVLRCERHQMTTILQMSWNLLFDKLLDDFCWHFFFPRKKLVASFIGFTCGKRARAGLQPYLTDIYQAHHLFCVVVFFRMCQSCSFFIGSIWQSVVVFMIFCWFPFEKQTCDYL